MLCQGLCPKDTKDPWDEEETSDRPEPSSSSAEGKIVNSDYWSINSKGQSCMALPLANVSHVCDEHAINVLGENFFR